LYILHPVENIHWTSFTNSTLSKAPSSLKFHRVIFFHIDPGEVAICFGDEGTWCPLYKHGIDGEIQQTYSDGEDTASSLISDDDLSNITENVKALNMETKHIPSTQTTDSRSSSSLASSSRTSSPFLNTIATTQIQTMNDCNIQQNNYWFQQQLTM
jgi:hypothetical protein